MERRLSELATLVRGVTFSKSEGATSHSAGLLPVIRAGSIQRQLLVDKDQIWVPKEKIRDEQLIRKDDIVMCTSSGSPSLVGKCAKSDRDWNGSFGAFCAGIRPKKEVCDASFLYHFLSSPRFRAWSSGAEGANIKNIRASELAQFPVPNTPLSEQRRIATILDKADAIRRKRQQAIELADQFLRSVFLDLFGDISSRGSKKVLLGDAVTIDAPMVDPKLKEYLDLVHIGPDRIEKETGRLLPALTARQEGLISNKFVFDDRYVLYSKIRPYLKKCALAVGRGLCSADMYPIRPNEDVMTREFLWMMLLSGPFDAYVSSLPGRANIPKLNRTELSAFEFWLPDLRVQLKFSEVVKKTNALKERLRATVDSPDTLFGALSQKAFAGKL